MFTSDMGTGLSAVVADHIDKRAPRLNRHTIDLAVEVKNNAEPLAHANLAMVTAFMQQPAPAHDG